MVKTLRVLRSLYDQITPWNYELLEEKINFDQILEKEFVDNVVQFVFEQREENKKE